MPANQAFETLGANQAALVAGPGMMALDLLLPVVVR
jgi:hypothetical protein